ncbi:MAG TPA: hypothetical protein VMZ04_09300 [Anaerolineae bacterium]|nr:hypothetical protein [Anaerolineae bacterium]
MKRRDFMAKGATGALGMGLAGCSAVRRRKVTLWKELAPFTPRPEGSMPTGEIGKTGIEVSKFGFGSHMRKDMVKYEKQRESVVSG